MASKSFIFRFADIEVREREFSLIKAGEVLPVEPKAFRVLLFLLHNPQKLITKHELLDAVWGETTVSENSLARSIALLRRLLADDMRSPRFIETVATIGYRFVPKIEALEDEAGILEAPQETNLLVTGRPVGIVANDQTGGTAANSAQIERETGEEAKSGTQVERRFSRAKWLVSGAVVFVAGLAATAWYLGRPMPPPRISDYTKITHDGEQKALGGTDGNRIYFTHLSPPPRFIGQIDAKGGEAVQLPVAVPGLPYLLDVSQDGSNLVVATLKQNSRENLVWIVPALGGSLHGLGDAHNAAFSPDGQSVVYTTSGGDIFVARIDGTSARKLVSVGGFVNDLAWSPDGGRIRFTKRDLIWEMSSAGSNLHQMLRGWHVSSHPCCGRWTADAKFFVFMTEPGGSKRMVNELWAIDERRGLLRQPRPEPVQLAIGPMSWGAPVPSKDGTRIFAEGTVNRGELCRWEAKSNQFLPFLGGISAEFVSFSKDGQFVAYVSFPEGVLWKADREGNHRIQLSDPAIVPVLPRWSPDGTQIAFTDLTSGDHPQIYTVSTNGSSPRRLLPDDSGSESDPNWSADGQKIVYSSGTGGNPKSDLRILEITNRQISAVPGSVGMFSPRWSPDGRSIAAISSDLMALMVFDMASQRWSKYPQKNGVSFPEWSGDSQSVYFLHYVIDSPGVFRLHVKSGEVERISDVKGLHTTGTVGGWLGLDPTDSPILLRDVGADDIYALTLQ